MTLREGLVQVYTGEAQETTLSAAGQALRSVGQGFRVCLIQFVKGCSDSRALKTALANQPSITIQQFGRSTALAPEAVEAGDLIRAQEALTAAGAAAAGGKYDLVILDQVILALHWKLIGLADLLSVLRHRHSNVELILTGCCAPPELIAVADLVTEMRQTKGSPQWGRPSAERPPPEIPSPPLAQGHQSADSPSPRRQERALVRTRCPCAAPHPHAPDA